MSLPPPHTMNRGQQYGIRPPTTYTITRYFSTSEVETHATVLPGVPLKYLGDD